MGAVIYDAERIGLRPDLRKLDDQDLHRFIEEAQRLQGQLADKWPSLGAVFEMLALLGKDWDAEHHDRGEGKTAEVTGVVFTDPTSPMDHLVDEYGRALAFIMPLVEDPGSSEALRGVWNGIMRDLATEVRVRQFKRLS